MHASSGWASSSRGLIELTTGIDLFPWNGSDPEFHRNPHQTSRWTVSSSRWFCPWSPYLLSSSSSIYGASCREGYPPGERYFMGAGAVASFAAALIPLNRGLIFALVPIAIIDSFSRHRLISRRIWATFFGIILLAAVAAKLLDPRLYDDRVSSPDNVYQRVAQHRETLRVVREYPLFGVGFGLYHDVASRNPRYMARWKGIESMNFPHNALMTVLSEEGMVGLSLYVSAQVFSFERCGRSAKPIHPVGWHFFTASSFT